MKMVLQQVKAIMFSDLHDKLLMEHQLQKKIVMSRPLVPAAVVMDSNFFSQTLMLSPATGLPFRCFHVILVLVQCTVYGDIGHLGLAALSSRAEKE